MKAITLLVRSATNEREKIKVRKFPSFKSAAEKMKSEAAYVISENGLVQNDPYDCGIGTRNAYAYTKNCDYEWAIRTIKL